MCLVCKIVDLESAYFFHTELQRIQLCSTEKYLDLIRSSKIHLYYQYMNLIVYKKNRKRKNLGRRNSRSCFDGFYLQFWSGLAPCAHFPSDIARSTISAHAKRAPRKCAQSITFMFLTLIC